MLVSNRDSYRTVAAKQSYLMDRESSKLGHFLTAPQEFIELLENPHTTSLKNLIADSSRGVTTGDNDFFIIDKEEAEARGIDEQFLTPILRWIKDMEAGKPVTHETSDNVVIDMNDYVEQVKRQGDFQQSDIEQRVKTALKNDGHQALLDYIRQGEAQEIDEKNTCESREVWFNVGELEHPDILVPKGFKYRLFIARNADGLAANNRLYCLDVERGVDKMALMGALNSTVFQAALETLGRVEGRGMMEISKGDLVSMPVLDVRNISDEEKEAIQDAYEALESGEDDARDRLDKAVVEAMGVDVDIDRLQELREMVTDQRNDRGTTTEVMVDRVDTLEEIGTHTFTVGTEGKGGDAQLSEFM